MRNFPILLALLGLLASCGSPDEAAHRAQDAATVEDDLGRSVVLRGEVARVIPLAPNLTEIVAAAGGAQRIIAISPSDTYPSSLLDLPVVSTYPLGLERVIELDPDLLLANAEVNRESDADRLSRLGVETYFFVFDSVGSVPRSMRKVGQLLGTEAQAEDAAASFEANLNAIRERTSQARARPRVLLLIGSETLYAFGGGSFTTELIEIAGGDSVTQRFRGDGVTLSAEFVLNEAPDIIVGAWSDDAEIGRLLEHHPALRTLDAARDGHIFAIDPDIIVRPGPRLAEAAVQLEQMIQAASR